MAVIIICINIQEVPALFALIFKSAFGLQSAFWWYRWRNDRDWC
ncbi:Sodium/proton-dependent alanine carrier protein [Staphylococcus aureus]|uniref:Sodium/proton-dependent alanine carrier protein n=1 Tax=Staphylococcus aureus TaxID=1280 RepID=A0A380DN89_STAAU|nr:Sodium/proton-dependent alanine carrier protein [Staphylococcus aureus]